MGTDDPTAASDVWTVQRILEWTTAFLKSKSVESARLEAELLLAHARGCQRIRLYTDFDVPVTEEQRTRMRELVQRRARREPLAYLVGSREFYGRSFDVGRGVLIPRPETETLVDVCLENIGTGDEQQWAEVGFGSGCISITLAKQCPRIRLVATDVSPQALEFAGRNVARHGVADQVELLPSDCLTALLDGSSGRSWTGQLHGIVSNPPYIRLDELSGLQPEVGQHEPAEALVSGVDGLDLVRRILEDAPRLLRPAGFLALELDPSQCQTVVEWLQQAGFTDVAIRQDLSGLDRVVSARTSAGPQ